MRDIRFKHNCRHIKKMNILIVDDSVFNRVVMEKILKAEGYENLTVLSSAIEVFQLLESSHSKERTIPIDLILMDNIMPEMSGIEACERLKKNEKYMDVPVIMITAKDDDIEYAFNAGALDYVTRPFKKEELLARIYLTLNLKYLINQQKEREQRLLHEIDLAKSIQTSVLTPPIKNEQIDIDAFYEPSAGLSGDMYYCGQIDANKYGIFIMDVAGHGISSALISMSLRSLLDGMIKKGLDPREVIAEMNNHIFRLYQTTKGRAYLTALYLIIDTNEKTIEYVNAGHPPALVFHPDSQVSHLSRTTIPVGARHGIEVQKEILHFTDSVQLFLYTDGLVEVPKQSIKAGIADLEEAILEIQHLDNTPFFAHLLARRREIAAVNDDVCLVRVRITI
ncbi:fused response regulator/phosphatase [Caldalkalibacillus mannanilyticus]|uniref:fused response regulator/phosphatase n=1 Tax=Caldalkalibacillus mannanilyticus TaxID=1418 RepID=UPI0009DD899E|nr:fused response regulator/phosphatase [Caldalkalibacillus mannanilyticus]